MTEGGVLNIEKKTRTIPIKIAHDDIQEGLFGSCQSTSLRLS